jgi:hypothetical protein
VKDAKERTHIAEEPHKSQMEIVTDFTSWLVLTIILFYASLSQPIKIPAITQILVGYFCYLHKGKQSSWNHRLWKGNENSTCSSLVHTHTNTHTHIVELHDEKNVCSFYDMIKIPQSIPNCLVMFI